MATIDKGELALRQVEEKYSWENHWENRNREKDFQSFLSKLQRAGKAAGGLAGNDSATDLSARIFTEADKWECRQELLDKVGGKPREFASFVASPIEAKLFDMLKSAPDDLMSTILSMNLHALVEKVGTHEDYISSILNVLQFDEAALGENHLNVPMLGLSCEASRAREMAGKLQVSIVLALGNVVFKLSDESSIGAIAKAISERCPKLIEDIADVDAWGDQLVCGLTPQAAVDLGAVAIVGQVVDARRNVDLQGESVPIQHSTRLAAMALLKNASKLSPRMKVNFKSLGGSHATHGKQAWDTMTNLSEMHAKQCENMFQNRFAGRVKEMIKRGDGGRLEEAYEVLVEICSDGVSEAKQFGDVFCQGGLTIDSQEGRDMFGLGAKFIEVSLKVFNEVVDLTDSFKDLVEGIYSGSGYSPELPDRQQPPEDEVPDLWDMANVFYHIFKILEHFSPPAEEACVLFHLTNHLAVTIKLAEARDKEILPDPTEMINKWTEAPAQGMKTLTNLLTIKKDILPPGAVDVLKVAVIFDRVLSADERQKAGRSVSLIDVNDLLSSMSWALTQFVSACEKHAVFDRVYQQGLKEWDALVAQQKTAMAFISSLQGDWIANYSNDLNVAIEKWDFTDVALLNGGADPKVKQLGQQIANAVAQFPTNEKIIGTVVKSVDWHNPDKRQEIEELQAMIRHRKGILEKSAVLAASIALVRLVTTTDGKPTLADYDQTTKWVKVNLNVQLENLPPNLNRHLGEFKSLLAGAPVNKPPADVASIASVSTAPSGSSKKKWATS
ncbi:unnamed protein product, partial [Prorocentrum cordatum]